MLLAESDICVSTLPLAYFALSSVSLSMPSTIQSLSYCIYSYVQALTGQQLFHAAKTMFVNLVEAHCYGIGRTGQIFEQSRSSEETDRNVDVSICFFTAT